MIVRLEINATYSAILYDYRRVLVLLVFSLSYLLQLLLKMRDQYIGNTIRLLRTGSAISFFVELAGSTVADNGGLIYCVTSSYIGTAFLFHGLLAI